MRDTAAELVPLAQKMVDRLIIEADVVELYRSLAESSPETIA